MSDQWTCGHTATAMCAECHRLLAKRASLLAEENLKLREACREAIAFLEAPPDSPRLWPISRANLGRLLTDAFKGGALA